jgi:hypothetical protein
VVNGIGILPLIVLPVARVMDKRSPQGSERERGGGREREREGERESIFKE